MVANAEQKIFLPLKVVAPLLGISVATLRKRIKNSEVTGIKTSHGYLLELHCNELPHKVQSWFQMLGHMGSDAIDAEAKQYSTKPNALHTLVGSKDVSDLGETDIESPHTLKDDVVPHYVIRPNNKILIVDDQKFSRSLLGDLVTDFGYEPFFAKNGFEALDILASDFISIVLTDLEMPEMNGLELLAEVKERHPQTDVIMITGNATVQSAIDAMKKGAEDYLTKPVKNDELKMLLLRCQRRQFLEFERYKLQVASRDLEKENLELKKFLHFFEQSKHINSSMELNRLLDMIVDFSTVQTNALKGSLFLLNEKTGKIQLKSSKGIDPTGIREFSVGEGFLGKVAQTGKPVLLAPPRPDRSGNKPEIKLRTIPSCIYVPMKLKTKTIGIMCVFDKLNGQVFDNIDLLLLKMLSEQAVVAIRNAKMFRFAEEKTIKDPMTNLYSPYFFIEYLNKEIARSGQDGVLFSVAFFALRQGESLSVLHSRDWVIVKKQLAKIASHTLRRSDILAVWKKNRFALLLTNVPDNVVKSVVHRLKRKIEQDSLINKYLPSAKVTLILLTNKDVKNSDAQKIVAEGLTRCNRLLDKRNSIQG